MALVYLGLGTNLGNKPMNLNFAEQSIQLEIGSILEVSSFYASKPWGFESVNDFLNEVMLIETDLSPLELLNKIKLIEKKMGRAINLDGKYHDRIIDIDILFYDNQIVRLPNLIIPHPMLEKRDFVLIPLSEIAPDFVHPLLQKTILSMKNDLMNE